MAPMDWVLAATLFVNRFSVVLIAPSRASVVSVLSLLPLTNESPSSRFDEYDIEHGAHQSA